MKYSTSCIIASIISVLAMGTGPCDMFDMDEDEVEPVITDGGACTLELCEHQLLIEVLRPDDDPFMVGLYRFSFITQNEDDYWIECRMLNEESGLDCTMGDLDLIFAQVTYANRSIMLHLVGAPPSIYATIEHNGAVIGTRTFTPEYQEVTPNGEYCEPVCYHGAESMAVTPW